MKKIVTLINQGSVTMATKRYTMAVVLKSVEAGNGDQFAMITWTSSMVTWHVNKWATTGKTSMQMFPTQFCYKFVFNDIILK